MKISKADLAAISIVAIHNNSKLSKGQKHKAIVDVINQYETEVIVAKNKHILYLEKQVAQFNTVKHLLK